MKLPTIYSPRNYTRVTIGPVTVWFSYTTPIAFQTLGEPPVVRQNEWGSTTGKHLNRVDGGDKKLRVSGSEFECQLCKLTCVIVPCDAH